MQERDFVVLEEYMRHAADTLGLRDWRVDVSRNPSSDENRACSDFVFGKRHVTVAFNREFRTYDADQQRETIAHELLHCHFDSLTDVIRDELTHLGRLNEGELASVRRAHLRAEELSVDALSRVVSVLLPHVDWGDE